MISVLTCADTKFFPLALRLARNLHLFPQCRLYLYDLGLREQEREQLEQAGVQIEIIPLTEQMFAMNSDNNIRATHKMDCIEHFLQKYKEGVLVLDADVLLVEDCFAELYPLEKDVVVTYRCDRENKPHILSNGKINTGVMSFGAKLDHAFFERWRAICTDAEQTDQSALSLLLDSCVDWKCFNAAQPCMGGQVRILDGNLYNDTTCRIGKIFHFKSVGRVLHKKAGYWLFAVLQTAFPSLVRKTVAYNREHRLFVWRPKSAR